MPSNTILQRLAAAALVLAVAACDDQPTDPVSGIDERRESGPNTAAPAPSGRIALQTTTGEIVAWPFTGSDLTSTGVDPVSLVFSGEADPRQIRAALLALDGNRTAFGFPASAPFDCRWTDTPSGGIQATYTDSAGWQGSAIQLQCGDYAPVRFHLRLFRHLGVTLGGAHFEVLIPGTTDHQVLSWELAEQLLTADMARTGLLGAAPAPSGAFYPAPSWRSIPAIIWNGLPPELQYLATGNPGPATADVPIPSDGNATMFFLAVPTAVRPDVVRRTFTLQFDQVIPKPFCNGPADYVYVKGPVTLRETASIGAGGLYMSEFHANGRLEVTPVDQATGQPLAAPYVAEVREVHGSTLANRFQRVTSYLQQSLLPVGQSGHGRLEVRLVVDARGVARNDVDLRCTDGQSSVTAGAVAGERRLYGVLSGREY